MRKTVFYLVAVNMDGGGFYNRRSPAAGVHFGGTSNYYSGIPDQIGAGHGIPSHTPGHVEINQKLDRLIGLVESQQKETESIKSNMAKFREEFDTLKSYVSTAATQSTPVSKRVPSKLSVSHVYNDSAILIVVCKLVLLFIVCVVSVVYILLGYC